MADRSLAVVILHYGDPGLTRRLYRGLLASDPDQAEHIRVLDNHAPQPFEGAWHRTPENLYWPGALDWCAKSVANEGYTHLWFLNNDLWFGSDPPHVKRAFGRLARLDKTLGPVGIWSPTATSNPYHPQMVAAPGLQFRTTEVLDGIAPLFNLECLEKIGWVDHEGNPYGYGVEMWLSILARRAGYALVADHQVRVRHVYHSTARTVDGFLDKAARAEQAYLAARLGPDHAEILKELKSRFTDHHRM